MSNCVPCDDEHARLQSTIRCCEVWPRLERWCSRSSSRSLPLLLLTQTLAEDDETGVAEAESAVDAIPSEDDEAGVDEAAGDADAISTEDVEAGVEETTGDADAISTSDFGERIELATWSVPHWLTRKWKLPNVRSIPECTRANADRSEVECGMNSKVPSTYGFLRSRGSRDGPAAAAAHGAADSVDPTPFFPTDGAI